MPDINPTPIASGGRERLSAIINFGVVAQSNYPLSVDSL